MAAHCYVCLEQMLLINSLVAFAELLLGQQNLRNVCICIHGEIECVCGSAKSAFES